jgi:outer membrane biosynthesis protein TonB
LKLDEQSRVVIPPGARKNRLTADTRDTTIVFVDIDPMPAAPEASNATKPVPSKNPEPKRVDLIATPAKPPPAAETVQAQPVTPLPPPVQKNPPQSETANPSSKGDLSLADPRAEKLQTRSIIATNAVQASKPVSSENPRSPGGSSAVASAGKPAGVPEKATSATLPSRRPTLEIDLKAAPFGSYDTAIVAAVQKRWYELLDDRKTAREGKGRVVVEFRLKYDGHISDLKITYREVDDILSLICQRAVTDPAPFAAWPREMRRSVAANSRSVRFTFVY